MNDMEEILQKLANLQYIDRRIDELDQLRGNLPEEILDIQTDVNRQQAHLNRLQEKKENLEQEAGEMELETKDAQARLAKYEDQQTSVRNNREYDALSREITAQKQVIENAESRREEIAKQREEIEPKIEQARTERERREELKAEKEEQLEAVKATTELSKRKLENKRKQVEKDLEPRYLRSYKRLRKGLKNGLAVVPMEKGAAIGMALPPQTQVEVRRKNKIIIDENSGRIVVHPSFFEEAEKQLS
jgi:predicted  nucleic acid-binding Zn-ribbon protein